MANPAPIILACASPPGPAPRALVRVSGDHLQPLAEALCDPLPAARDLRPARITLFKPPPLPGAERPILPALAAFFPGPHSFTGEDVLELQVPGNPALVERLLHGIINRAGTLGREARLAEPGEFTRRAFTAGRIDLTRAEGIAATVAAQSDAELHAARLLRRGQLGQWSEALVDRLANLLALVEAGIDFVDQDDVIAIAPADLLGRLRVQRDEVASMLRRSRSWSQLEALPWVVLVGPPNAGKSTLFNALLGRERAVASGEAGTTRDVLSEPMRIERGGRAAELMLVDIAGLDEPTAALDEAVQRSARAAIDRAELMLLISDRAQPQAGPWTEAAAATATPRLTVHTKADRSRDTSADFNVSAITGEGLADLRAALAGRLAERAVAIGGEMLTLQPRHRAAMEAARDALTEAIAEVEPHERAADLDQPELVAAAMRTALDQLGAVGGRMSPDEVIGRVFATFCIGK